MRLPSALLVLLLLSCASSPRDSSTLPRPEEELPIPSVMRLAPQGPEWMAIYLLGQKAGFTVQEVAPDELRGEPVVRIDSKVLFSASVGGSTVERRMEESRYYQRRDGGRLLAFTALRTGDGGEVKLEGTCSIEACDVVVQAEGKRTHHTVSHGGEQLEDGDPLRFVARERKGRKSVSLDLDRLEPRTTIHRYLGEEQQTIGGRAQWVAKVGSKEEGEALEGVTLVALDSGRILELALGPAMVARAEVETAARKLAGGALDLFGLTKVGLPAPLQTGAARVTLVVAGLPEEFRRIDARQAFVSLADGNTRIELSARAPTHRAVLPLEGFAEELRATTAIDFDEPAIRKLAKQLVPEQRPDAYTAAGAILGYVHGSLRKVYGHSSDRASRVLAQGQGDCTEHALLFTALARAIGLPARRVHGLVYSSTDGDPGRPALFWHEWVEVFVGEWVAMDPTFGQAVADATHLKLGEGDQGSAVGLLGQLQVIEAKGTD